MDLSTVEQRLMIGGMLDSDDFFEKVIVVIV